MAEIITQLPGLKKRVLLSATDAEEIPRFTGLNRTNKLNFLSDIPAEAPRLTLMKVISPVKDKIDTLYKLLCTLGSSSSIVFCNHRDAVAASGTLGLQVRVDRLFEQIMGEDQNFGRRPIEVK